MNVKFLIRVGRMPVKKIATTLFGGVSFEVSATVVRLGRGQCEIQLFDSFDWERAQRRRWPARGRVFLISNHPGGRMRPSEEDLQNLRHIPRARLFIVCGRRCVYVDRRH